MKTLIQVTNDTIAVKHVSGLPAATTTQKSTLGLATVASSHKNPAPTKGKSRRTYPVNKCFVCKEVKGAYGKHSTQMCPDYPTAKSRRDALTKIKRCPYCAKQEHRGVPGKKMDCETNEGAYCKADKCVGKPRHYGAYCDHWEAELAAKVKPKK